MKLSHFLFFNIGLALLTSCGGGGSSVNDKKNKELAKQFVKNLNLEDIDNSYSLTKSPTQRGNKYIIINEGDGNLRGLKFISDKSKEYVTDLAFYKAESFEVQEYYTYDDLGNQYFAGYIDSGSNVYEKVTEATKDLSKISGIISKIRAQKLGEQLAANYGLAEQRGLELGQLLVQYKDLESRRALDGEKEDIFAKLAFGATGSTMSDAYSKSKTGNSSDMDSLIESAAKLNGTTPENVRDILSKVPDQ